MKTVIKFQGFAYKLGTNMESSIRMEIFDGVVSIRASVIQKAP